jgi:hypothetical protein
MNTPLIQNMQRERQKRQLFYGGNILVITFGVCFAISELLPAFVK